MSKFYQPFRLESKMRELRCPLNLTEQCKGTECVAFFRQAVRKDPNDPYNKEYVPVEPPAGICLFVDQKD